ncbi:MAG: AAA family ATPase [Candidatus Sericytochromatia bacterium]|nr:AAA family ATPase [Candidatus Sericytochromatia bacterium]
MAIIERNIADNMDQLLDILPADIRTRLKQQPQLDTLLEVVLDLGRSPEGRFPGRIVYLRDEPVSQEEIQFAVSRVGCFGGDNRAGIERTLHRISAIRNRRGDIVGLTCRVGRAIHGTIDIVRDLVESGRSILMMGRPGVGKTTKLREMARILAEDFGKRVIIIDTSNEIAGDGDIAHPAIGRARRMQVPTPDKQHAVMIEAVENHMPEVIIIDEISTQAEADAARTIAERGVQLIGTAHGNSIENLMMNPSLNDLVGGIQSVTLGDEEARRRGTQKTVLERKAPPTFDIAIEIQDRYRLAVHQDVAEVIDQLLRGWPPQPEIRLIDDAGEIHIFHEQAQEYSSHTETVVGKESQLMRIFPYAVSRSQLERVIRGMRMPATVTKNLEDADVILLLKSYAKGSAKIMALAEENKVPVYIVKSNTIPQIQKTLRELMNLDTVNGGNANGYDERQAAEAEALEEARVAIEQVAVNNQPIDLPPRDAAIRRQQEQLIGQYHLRAEAIGVDPGRRLRVFPRGTM